MDLSSTTGTVHPSSNQQCDAARSQQHATTIGAMSALVDARTCTLPLDLGAFGVASGYSSGYTISPCFGEGQRYMQIVAAQSQSQPQPQSQSQSQSQPHDKHATL